MYLYLQLILILHLAQVHKLFMANYLILIVCKRIKCVRFVITKSRVINFELSQYAGKLNWNCHTQLILGLIFLRLLR